MGSGSQAAAQAAARLRRTALLCAVLLIGGCAPYSQPWPRPYRAPALAAHAFITADGVSLPLSRWLPRGAPHAVIIALHGFADYRRAFAYLGSYLARHGIAVYAYDQRGFGAAPHPGRWPGAAVLAGDLRQISALIRRRYPGTPVYWLGQSMGAAVVIRAAAGKDVPPIDGVILDAPAVWGDGEFSSWYRTALWIGAHTLPWLHLSGSRLHVQTTDNIRLLRQLVHDPLMQRSARIDALYALVRLMDHALHLGAALRPPALIQYGLHDEVIPRAAVCDFIGRLHDPVTVALYPHGYHLILRDVHAPAVWADIASWITVRRVKAAAGPRRICGKAAAR